MTPAQEVVRQITRRESSGSALLWFGLLGGPLAWTLELVVNYSLEEWFACSPATTSPGLVLGIGVRNFALVVTGALAAVTVLAGAVSIKCYRGTGPPNGSSAGRAGWMALAGIMNSVLYLILIVASFAPPAILGVCESSP